MALRPSAVAGRWYPHSAKELAREVDAYVARAQAEPLPRLRAVIAPHAGLTYSGPVAAFAYKAAAAFNYSTVVLLGPSHFVPFKGVSIWRSGAWDTPFGPMAVDEGLATGIMQQSPLVSELPAAHGREHSLEMQLPFLARLLPGARIVPMVMGHQTRDTAEQLGDALSRAIAARESAQSFDRRALLPGMDADDRDELVAPPDREVLLVASSDLSHFEDAPAAAALDSVVLRHVEGLDADGLMEALERDPRHACGGGPMVAVLRAARQLGATHGRVLQYADSGDVSGDKASVVGYMAAAVW